MSAIKGLELAYNYYRIGGLNTPEDAFVIAFHSVLLLFDFRCFGLATEEVNVAAETTELGSELLPENWNSYDFYAFKYVVQKQVFIVKIVKISKTNSNKLYVNVLRPQDNKLISLTFKVQDFVTDQLTDFKKLYVNVDTLQSRIKKELIDEIFPKIGNDPHTSRSSRSERDTQVPLELPARRGLREDFGHEHFDDPVRNLGRSDLDPLGRGGGMLLDHRDLMRHPRPDLGMPRGAVPPGARFYPVFPHGVGRGAGPDPDHLPPPGYDDMFG